MIPDESGKEEPMVDCATAQKIAQYLRGVTDVKMRVIDLHMTTNISATRIRKGGHYWLTLYMVSQVSRALKILGYDNDPEISRTAGRAGQKSFKMPVPGVRSRTFRNEFDVMQRQGLGYHR